MSLATPSQLIAASDKQLFLVIWKHYLQKFETRLTIFYQVNNYQLSVTQKLSLQRFGGTPPKTERVEYMLQNHPIFTFAINILDLLVQFMIRFVMMCDIVASQGRRFLPLDQRMGPPSHEIASKSSRNRKKRLQVTVFIC